MSGFLIGMGGALTMALAGYWHDVYLGTVSVFFVLIMVQRFFGDASYAIIGPYLAEVWPNRLRGSGMGFSYGIGNLGKIIGPLGLALIVGSSNYVSPKVTVDALFPALLFLAFWYGRGDRPRARCTGAGARQGGGDPNLTPEAAGSLGAFRRVGPPLSIGGRRPCAARRLLSGSAPLARIAAWHAGTAGGSGSPRVDRAHSGPRR
jgi:MFS family permease